MSTIIFWEVAGASWLCHVRRCGEGGKVMHGHRGYLSQWSMTKPFCLSVCRRKVLPSDGQCPFLHFTCHLAQGPVVVCLPAAIKHKYGTILTCCVGRLMLPAHKMHSRKRTWGNRGHSKKNPSRNCKSECVFFQHRAGEDWLLLSNKRWLKSVPTRVCRAIEYGKLVIRSHCSSEHLVY